MKVNTRCTTADLVRYLSGGLGLYDTATGQIWINQDGIDKDYLVITCGDEQKVVKPIDNQINSDGSVTIQNVDDERDVMLVKPINI